MHARAARSALAVALAFCVVAGLALTGCAQETPRTPRRDSRVVDAPGVLSDGQLRSIADYLEFVEFERGVDYRVLVIDDPFADLMQTAVSSYQSMAIGAQTAGQGLLLLVDVGANRARVEVGYGLEHRVRDAEASSMIIQFLAPYFESGQVANGIEASVERLVDVLRPSREETPAGHPVLGSGGAGATEALLAGIDSLTPETKARLKTILVPQAHPEDCVHLEIALMHRGIYYRDVPMYDGAWRRADRPDLPAQRLKSLAREWDGPFEIARAGGHAIVYFTGEKAMRWGPQFLRRTDEGWIVEASLVARYIVYDYSNATWYAVDGDYPYLNLIKQVFPMMPTRLHERGPAWVIDRGE